MAARKTNTKKAAKPAGPKVTSPTIAPHSPKRFRARVRMYRQGLGDCFLLTFPKKTGRPIHILIDCGALGVDKAFMTEIVQHIRDTVQSRNRTQKATLDVVVATHEHKDHLSGFNQAREVFNKDFDINSVWLGWTENLSSNEIKQIKEAKKKARAKLAAAVNSRFATLAPDTFAGIRSLLAFTEDDDDAGTGRIAEALDYLKLRGKEAGDLRFLEPGSDPIELPEVGVRIYVLGPPRDPILLKSSEVTEQMKKDGVIYHLSRVGEAGIDALAAGANPSLVTDDDRFHPFAAEHRIARTNTDAQTGTTRPNPYYPGIEHFVAKTYDNPAEAWRRIDSDWLGGFGQLALDLDSDTNNTSLVLAFEFVKTKEVLLFVGDAQVGNWQSWANVSFQVPGRSKPLPAHDLLGRTIFYKVGHHCSHNGTIGVGGLELMTREDLVAFIPLDQATAKKQGTKGWDMPAAPLFKALKQKAGNRVALSDVAEKPPKEATQAGVIVTANYLDYFLQ